MDRKQVVFISILLYGIVILIAVVLTQYANNQKKATPDVATPEIATLATSNRAVAPNEPIQEVTITRAVTATPTPTEEAKITVELSGGISITPTPTPTPVPQKTATVEKVASCGDATVESDSTSVLTKSKGVNNGPSGKETYYNLNMSGVVAIMRNCGYSAEEYPYWVREDGVKMLGDYVMVAASLDLRPRGTILPCSLGTAIVCDTGSFAISNPTQLDIAVNW